MEEKQVIQIKNEEKKETALMEKSLDRNSFLKKVGGGIFASLLLPGVISKSFTAKANELVNKIDLPKLPPKTPDEDVIVRMMRDLQRALKKPLAERRWSMVIDLRKCIGCDSCTISCAAENKLPPGVVYRPVLKEEIGTYPNVSERYIPRPCMQCSKPPCTDVCPVSATWKREDGVVEIDYEQCIGCRYCITACPYSARTFDAGHDYMSNAADGGSCFTGKEVAGKYEAEPVFDYSKEWPREEGKSPEGNVRKCHFCLHRVEKGLLPECTVSCIGRATYFGDANDSKSLVAELIGKPNVMRLKEEMGTEPNVYYLM